MKFRLVLLVHLLIPVASCQTSKTPTTPFVLDSYSSRSMGGYTTVDAPCIIEYVEKYGDTGWKTGLRDKRLVFHESLKGDVKPIKTVIVMPDDERVLRIQLRVCDLFLYVYSKRIDPNFRLRSASTHDERDRMIEAILLDLDVGNVR